MESNVIKMPVLQGNQKAMRMFVRKNTVNRKSSVSKNSRQRSHLKKNLPHNSRSQSHKSQATRPKMNSYATHSRKSSKGMRSRVSSLANTSEIRTESLDLAPKVRKNKKSNNMSSGMFNFEEAESEYHDFEKITAFLKKAIKSKNLKDYIKANQTVFDDFIDRVDSGQWMGIDLRSMHGFFIKCFKNKVGHLFK